MTTPALPTVPEVCTLRDSVLTDAFRDYALNLSDLVQNKVDPEEFFEENYVTEGMQQLLRFAFERFRGDSQTSVIKLTQAMGGGKTHNMIALALAARHPEFRKRLDADFPAFDKPVRVAAFTGRESDTPYGIWGALADQIGKREEFSPYYKNGLEAPGETAWVKLLQGEPLLILLDELPPYFEYAAARPVGNADLAVVTTTALANLFVAAGKQELRNVLIVISDLKATYEGGSNRLGEALRNLDNEVERTSLNLEPVRQNSDEVYHILKRKLFAKLPDNKTIDTVAVAYAAELQKAKQMELTLASPDEFAARIREAYPFHPALRDLYARFKENPGFQQTRGLIRLLRAQVRALYAPDARRAGVYLLSPAAFDLNDATVHTHVTQINTTLTNAISHDIASGGSAEAELLDQGADDPLHQATLRTILLASLGLVQNAIRGLSEAELVHYLVAPGRDINQLRQKALPALRTRCWYLHIDREGRFLFRDIQNVVAKLNSLVGNFKPEQGKRAISKELEAIFRPQTKDVYQSLYALQPLDQVRLEAERTALVIYEPHPGGMHPDIQQFFNEQVFKNRVLFLSGDRASMDALVRSAREVLAIEEILKEFTGEKLPESDPQHRQALDLRDQYRQNFTSAARETFTRLYHPNALNPGEGKLFEAEFTMEFVANEYKGEEQVRAALEKKGKFLREPEAKDTLESFRKRCELRLFAGPEMEWSEVKKRAATQMIWPLHRPDALDRLKEQMLRQGFWRENGAYINKGPFPPPETGVQIQAIERDEKTGAVQLRLTPLNGDQVHYEINGRPTPASMQIKDLSRFATAELRVSFLCVDSSGKHPAGPPREWRNRIDLRYSKSVRNGKTFVQLQAVPDAPIRYSTDGTHPRDHGGSYAGEFEIKRKCLVMAVAERDGVESAVLQFEADPADEVGRIDMQKPAQWTPQPPCRQQNTDDVYRFLNTLRAARAAASDTRVIVSEESSGAFMELNTSDLVFLTADELQTLIEGLRAPLSQNEFQGRPLRITLVVNQLKFQSGADLEAFAKELNLTYDVRQVRQ